MHAKDLVKEARIREVMKRRRSPILSEIFFKSAIKIVLTKHVILIIRIIDIIRDSFKHDDNRQERPNEGPILNFNK